MYPDVSLWGELLLRFSTMALRRSAQELGVWTIPVGWSQGLPQQGPPFYQLTAGWVKDAEGIGGIGVVDVWSFLLAMFFLLMEMDENGLDSRIQPFISESQSCSKTQNDDLKGLKA